MSRDAKFISVIIVITIAIFGALIILSMRKKASPVDSTRLVREDSQQIGSSGAPVTLIEFADLECEACRVAHPTVKKILEEYQGKIHFVFRNFPLHKNSVLAAKAAEAAGEQGKFWEMHDLLFQKQQEWGEKQTPQTELFMSYADELKLDKERFSTSLNSAAYTDKINRDKDDGIASGVQGTPTFFLNGRQLKGVPRYEELKSLIEEELKK